MFDKSVELYDLFYDWKDYRAEAGKIRELVATRNPDARTLLDVACGTGSHLVHLRDWYAVEGLDLNAGFLKVAFRRLPEVKLHEADMIRQRSSRPRFSSLNKCCARFYQVPLSAYSSS